MQASLSRSDTDRAWPWYMLLVCIGFTLWTYGELRNTLSATWQDTSGYLAHALYIKERGGLLGFLRESFDGTFPITERHPLYMLLLAPFASREHEFFWVAKMVSLVTGFATLLSLIWMVTKRYGRFPALLAATCYALSYSLVLSASHVDNEPQFALCVIWAWWFLTHDPQAAADGGPTLPAAMPTATWRWAVGGAFVGLAFLAKSPAILIGLGVLVAGVLQQRLKFLVTARLWAFVAAAVLVASPLLVRNVIGFGTPIYEGMNNSITWIDDWSEVGGEHSIMYYDRYGVMTIESNGLPTARDYFRTHGVKDVAVRLVKGVYSELTQVAPKALGFAVPPGYRSALLGGTVLLAFAVGGWWLRRRSWEGMLMFVWTGAFIVFFGWDHMFPDVRYLAPLVPLWLMLSAYAIWRLALRVMQPPLAHGVTSAAAVAAVVVGCAWMLASGSLTEPRPVIAVSPAYERLNSWLERVIEPGDRIMFGPTREFHGMIWAMERPVSVVLTPDATNLADFLRYLDERSVRYLVMHPENYQGEAGFLKDALAPYFTVTADGQIESLQPLPGWTKIYADTGTPSRFIVLESKAVEAHVSHAAHRDAAAEAIALR